MKKPAYLTKYSFALELTTVIMVDVKSDQVKQSIDNLKKYRIFTEEKLKLFIHNEFDLCGCLLCKIMLEEEIYHAFTLTIPIDSGGKKQPCNVIFLPAWYRAGVVCTKCLLIFGTYSIDFILGSYTFHRLNTLRKL